MPKAASKPVRRAAKKVARKPVVQQTQTSPQPFIDYPTRTKVRDLETWVLGERSAETTRQALTASLRKEVKELEVSLSQERGLFEGLRREVASLQVDVKTILTSFATQIAKANFGEGSPVRIGYGRGVVVKIHRSFALVDMDNGQLLLHKVTDLQKLDAVPA